jgi:pimeloyl-ACP methyl ester carboxylesterase
MLLTESYIDQLQRNRLVLVALLVSAAILPVGCVMPPYDESVTENWIKGSVKPNYRESFIGKRKIFYVETGDSNQPLIVFIHGTPGSWKAFGQYLVNESLRSRAQLVAVDRPGFGQSDPKQIIPSLQKQSALLAQVLERDFRGRQAILVGHSIGASIAARLAMDYPDMIDGLVLVAPSIDPKLEKPRWYNHLADSTLLRWLLPTDLALANEEVMPLSDELSHMLPLWQRIRIPVIVIQGDKDRLSSPANADFAENVLGRRVQIIRVPRAGHFIIWKKPDITVEAILSLLENRNPLRLTVE